MPHLGPEYSADLNDRVDLGGLCGCLNGALLATGFSSRGAIRIRACCSDHYSIADELLDNGFIDAWLCVGEGRGDADQQQIGDELFAGLRSVLDGLFESPHFCLSSKAREISRAPS